MRWTNVRAFLWRNLVNNPHLWAAVIPAGVAATLASTAHASLKLYAVLAAALVGGCGYWGVQDFTSRRRKAREEAEGRLGRLEQQSRAQEEAFQAHATADQGFHRELTGTITEHEKLVRQVLATWFRSMRSIDRILATLSEHPSPDEIRTVGVQLAREISQNAIALCLGHIVTSCIKQWGVGRPSTDESLQTHGTFFARVAI